MKLEGELQDIDIIRHLLDLAESRFTGAIRFENDGVIKILYLKEGDVLSASTNDRADSVDEILLRAGKVNRDHIRQALGKRKDNETLGDALLALGFIAKKELVWARRVQAVGIIRSIRDWPAGSWQLVHDYLPKREEGTLYYLPQIILELIVTDSDRSAVEKRVDGGNPVFARTALFDDRYARLALNEDADRIVAEIDGDRTAAEIAAASKLETFAVYKLLLALESLGMLQRDKTQPSLEVSTLGAPASAAAFESDPDERVLSSEDDLSAHFSDETFGDPLSMPIETSIPAASAPTDWDAADTPEGLDQEVDPDPGVATAANDARYRHESSRNSILMLGALLVTMGVLAFFGYRWWSGQETPAEVETAPVTSIEELEPEASEPPSEEGLASNDAPIDPPLAAPAPVQPLPATPPPATATVAPPVSPPAGSTDPLRERYQSMADEFARERASVGYTVQFEIVCETASVTRALREGGDQVWFVPIRYRERPCFRVFWGRYDTREAAESAKGQIPASLSGSGPTIVRPGEVR
ncbi:MAG: DUF4388 domain-containing protein [Thermoanaerobaculia bacterium]